MHDNPLFMVHTYVIHVQVKNFRSPVSVEERVAVTIWKLATNVEYRTLSSLFGLGRSTVSKIVVEICCAILHIYSHSMSKFLLEKN